MSGTVSYPDGSADRLAGRGLLLVQDGASWLTSQTDDPVESWTGGRVVGGTLDRLVRGKPEGSMLRCWFAEATSRPPGSFVACWSLQPINLDLAAPLPDASTMFVVAMDIAERAEEEFNEWYDAEHIPALLRVPGVMSARRFSVVEGEPRYLAVYHLASPETYSSEVWCAADATPWIQRLRRFQSNRAYYMFRRDSEIPARRPDRGDDPWI